MRFARPFGPCGRSCRSPDRRDGAGAVAVGSALLALGLWGARVSDAAAPGAPRPEWARPVGRFRLVKWQRWKKMGDRVATLILRTPTGRVLGRVTNNQVGVHSITDLDGDGLRDLILWSYGTGAHGPMTYHCYTLGSRPRCLLRYHKNNVLDDVRTPDLALRDLDRDGRLEFLTWYDGFLCWSPPNDWGSSTAGAARIPILLGLRGRRYVEVTSRFPFWLRARTRAARARLKAELTRAAGDPLIGDRAQPVIEYYVLQRMRLGGRRATAALRALLPPADYRAFLRVQKEIDSIADARRGRYTYPRAW